MIHLFVGNLPLSVTVPQLTRFFADFGHVERVQLGRNHVTGRAERFCFLDLEEEPGGFQRLEAARFWGHALTVSDAMSPSGWAIGA